MLRNKALRTFLFFSYLIMVVKFKFWITKVVKKQKNRGLSKVFNVITRTCLGNYAYLFQ